MKSTIGVTVLGFLSLIVSSAAFADSPALTISDLKIFSLPIPAGWTLQNMTSADYPVAIQTKVDGSRASISVNVDTKAGSLDEWCKNSVAKNTQMFAKYHASFGNLVPFETAAGTKGFRCVVTLSTGSADLEIVDYFFAGGSDKKIVVTSTTSAAAADHDVPIFDSVAKTLVVH